MSMRWFDFFMILMLTRCGGVEVGNPHGGGGSGDEDSLSLSVEIADNPLDQIENIYITIESLKLIHEDGREISLLLNEKGQDPIDILSLNNGLSEVIVQNSLVPKGNYSGYLLSFSKERPVKILKSGVEFLPKITVDNIKSLLIEEEFSIEEDETLVLHMDLLSSITHDNGDYTFDPIVSSVKKNKASSIRGEFLISEEKGYVCAYRNDSHDFSLALSENKKIVPFYKKDPNHHLNLRNKARRPSFQKRNKAPIRGARLCDEGFAGSRLRANGDFGFHFLPPGIWDLRIYLENGTVYDSSESIDLRPAEHKELDNIQWNINTSE